MVRGPLTHRSRLALGPDGLGHLAQNLVPVSGHVAGRLRLLLLHFLAVDLQLHAVGGNQDVELREEKTSQWAFWARFWFTCQSKTSQFL